MSKEAVGLIDVSKNALRFILGLDTEFKSSAVYDKYSDTIMVKVLKDYKTTLQCPKEACIVLFEEDRDDSGNRPIAGFQIYGVSKICHEHNLRPMNNILKVSDVLKLLLKDKKIGLPGEIAIVLAMELLQRHELDLVTFPDF